MTFRRLPRWVRQLLLGALLVLLACTVIGLSCLAALHAANERVAGLTGRATGELSRVGPDADGTEVLVRWRAGGTLHSRVLRLDGAAPPAPIRAEVAYDPADPTRVLVPRAAVLRSADRSVTGMGFAAAFALGVLGYTGWLLLRVARLFDGPRRLIAVRRVRVQRGLLTRSWLEFEHAPRRWVPVHFDPALAGLPTPDELRVYRDPQRARLLGFETPDGTRIYPSGPARDAEPAGRRVDNPSRPDPAARRHAAASMGMARAFAADAPRLAVAPLVGAFWAMLDGSGFTGWLAATALVATLVLWLAAVRGSDPSA